MNLFSQDNTSILSRIDDILAEIDLYDNDAKMDIINRMRVKIHQISPMKSEPVDCVVWVKNTQVFANDYNPNSVAPVEMKLLEHSISEDGYTQPIVGYNKTNILQDLVNGSQVEVVDGFHRHRVGKEN